MRIEDPFSWKAFKYSWKDKDSIAVISHLSVLYSPFQPIFSSQIPDVPMLSWSSSPVGLMYKSESNKLIYTNTAGID